MRVPLHWLGEFVELGDLDAAAVAARLNVTGTELDRLDHQGVLTPDTVVIGRILECGPHPDADRLRLCRVATGEGDVVPIVCGAPNVAKDQIVAVALVGTRMADGTKIKKAKLRGQVSQGMICSARELGIGDEHDGILDLSDHIDVADEIRPGTMLSELVWHADDVLDLEITPNRPDCLGMYGIAREVAAATGAALRPAPWTEGAAHGVHAEDASVEDGDGQGPDAIDGIEIRVQTDRCPRFTARLFEDVVVGPSPLWLQARLAAAGQRPINNVVDVTNLVMLETGQPLHAFDADRVAGGRLVVREATAGETLTTLDEQERTLQAGELVIDDADGPTSLAGVMGGGRSEVTPQTTRVLLEVASWDGPTIHATAGRLGLFSEAATRNAKGLAPEQCTWAQVVATRLLRQVAGARKVGGTIDVGWTPEPPATITVREARVARILGVAVDRPRQTALLEALGFGVTDPDPAAAAGEGTLDVVVPPERRTDVAREIDLIEEIARLGVIADLAPTFPARRRPTAARLTPRQRARRRVEDVLAGRGLQEVAGWSFADPARIADLGLAPDDPRAAAVALQDPLGEDQSVLRPTILLSLLDVARRNRARGAEDVRIFETGTVFRDAPDPRRPEMPFEHLAVGALVTADLFAAKGLLEAVFAALHLPAPRVQATGEVAFLHPGRAATIHLDGVDGPVGLLGEVHPRVADRWDLPRVATMLVDLDRVLPHVPGDAAFRAVGQYPDARFDLAVVVEDAVTADRVLEAVRGAGGPLLEDASVFDVYRGQGIPDGHVSLALRLRLRSPERTLEDADIAGVRDGVTAALADQVGGRLRG